VIQEQLHGMQIRAALEQPAASLAPQIVHVEVHLRDLLAAAGQEPAVRSLVWPVAERASPKRRPRLLIVLQAFADFVAEHVRFRSELVAIRIVSS
jgi:hypothetical protein